MQIKLKYKINGAVFRLRFERHEYRAARVRAQVLRDNGIEVKVTGVPKRINT